MPANRACPRGRGRHRQMRGWDEESGSHYMARTVGDLSIHSLIHSFDRVQRLWSRGPEDEQDSQGGQSGKEILGTGVSTKMWIHAWRGKPYGTSRFIWYWGLKEEMGQQGLLNRCQILKCFVVYGEDDVCEATGEPSWAPWGGSVLIQKHVMSPARFWAGKFWLGIKWWAEPVTMPALLQLIL